MLQDFDNAVEETGYGKFHILVLLLCGLIYADTAIAITLLSFVLPAAACVYGLDSSDKGLLTATPMLGMVFGCYFWGTLGDTKGRKVVLIGSLLMDGVVSCLSSISPYFWLFVTCRFLNGFAITGAMSICFSYLGEFQTNRIRETVLCWMELFWAGGVILLPGTAWLIIPLDVNYESDYGFKFASWNLFVFICSLPSIALGLWLLWFPESPKFLLENGEPDLALEVLRDMFVMNTGKHFVEYPIVSLIETHRYTNVRELSLDKTVDVRILMYNICQQTKRLFRPPHLKNTVLSVILNLGLTSSYYTLMVWFPELFQRFEQFENDHPGDKASLCQISEMPEHGDPCDPIGVTVYFNTVIIGIACIPTSLWLPLCVNRLGAKFFLIFTLWVPSCVVVGFYFVNSSLLNLIMSCLFESLTSLNISLIYTVMVELFPTQLRVTACALGLAAGRIGALVGNLVLGYLIDINCIIPLLLFSFLLFVAGLVCFFLPLKRKDPDLAVGAHDDDNVTKSSKFAKK